MWRPLLPEGVGEEGEGKGLDELGGEMGGSCHMSFDISFVVSTLPESDV